MNIVSAYLKKWHLRLCVGKTMSSIFQLNHRKMKVMAENACQQFQSIPIYLGVKQFKKHLESVKAKISVHVAT